MPDADFGTEGQETEEGHKLDPSKKQGLPYNILQALAQDIEHKLGGLYTLEPKDTKIAHLCERFPDLYGKSHSSVRRQVQNKVGRWKLKQPENYLKDLEWLLVKPSIHTVLHARKVPAKRPSGTKAAVEEEALSEEFENLLKLSSPPRTDTRAAFSPPPYNPTSAAKETHHIISPLQSTPTFALKQLYSPIPHQPNGSIMSHPGAPGYPADFDPVRCRDEKVNLVNPELNSTFKAYMLRDCTITGSIPPEICDGVFIKKTDGEVPDVLANKIKLYVIPTEEHALLLEEPAYPASETTQDNFDRWRDACQTRNNVTVEETAFNVMGAALTNVNSNAARQKKWTKLIFEGRNRFDNEVFSRGLGNLVRPVPVPIQLRPVMFGPAQNRVTMQMSTCPIVWHIAYKDTVRPTQAGNEPQNIMEAALNGQFAAMNMNPPVPPAPEPVPPVPPVPPAPEPVPPVPPAPEPAPPGQEMIIDPPAPIPPAGPEPAPGFDLPIPPTGPPGETDEARQLRVQAALRRQQEQARANEIEEARLALVRDSRTPRSALRRREESERARASRRMAAQNRNRATTRAQTRAQTASRQGVTVEEGHPEQGVPIDDDAAVGAINNTIQDVTQHMVEGQALLDGQQGEQLPRALFAGGQDTVTTVNSSSDEDSL